MTGADIVGALLRADVPVLAKVAAPRIKGGRLPAGVQLPALMVKVTSSIERHTLVREGKVRTIDRVSVTVRAENYNDQTDIIDLVKTACAGKTGDIGGGERVSILNAGKGPDRDGPADTYEQTIDFRVSFVADA